MGRGGGGGKEGKEEGRGRVDAAAQARKAR